jgi:hypothetical protein
MPSRDSRGRFTGGGGGLTISLDLNSGALRKNIETFPGRLDDMIHAVMVYQASKAEGYMKVNARWTDRTGNARNGLSSAVVWEPLALHAIRLFHRVSYGIFLEVRWAGRYAIILPTIQRFGPDTMKVLNKLFARLKLGGV